MSVPSITQVNVFIDSDGVVADYDKALQASGLHVNEFKYQPGTYLWLDIMPGAIEALASLKKLDDADRLRVWILSKTPSGSPYAYTEKVLWYRQHFPWLEDRIMLVHDKHQVGSVNDILIDDRPHKGHADKFRGRFIKFEPSVPISSWTGAQKQILSHLSEMEI